MDTRKYTKIRNLTVIWPKHTLAPAKWLCSEGYSPDLIKRYVSSGWLERIHRGVFVHPNDDVDWRGVVWGMQKAEPMVVGGKTALELLGKAHYVTHTKNTVFLFMERGTTPPVWGTYLQEQINPIFVTTNLFDQNVCRQEVDCGEFTLTVSNPARAMCEYIYLMDKHHTPEEAFYLMENLRSMSPKVVQEALERCHSVKVKRLFLSLAHLLRTNWYTRLDFSHINLGSGKRHLEAYTTAFDSKYEISYPEAWNKKSEDESVF